MRIAVLIVTIAALLLAPGAARGQEEPALSSVRISLWPEYDRPSLLVLYDLSLPAGTQLPAALTVRIPAATGQVNAVAAQQPDTALVNLPYEQEVMGEWREVSFNATTLEVRIEYYDTGLEKDGAARHFEYRWPGDHAVDSLVVQVQQPIGATDMRISPNPGEGSAPQDGLVYYTSEVGALAAGQDFVMTLDYQKADDSLTVEKLPVGSTGATPPTAGGITAQAALPWVLGGLGLLLIAGGGLWYLQSRRPPAQAGRRTSDRGHRRSAAGRSEPEAAPPGPGGHIYCHQCGKRAAPGDRFCRTCGTQLRSG